ncbi:MAG: hypothetical protein GXY38_01565 [Planctomycetes bacterium]|nr:hypothetical protein [Planctomycetota bacterium]
MKVPLRADVDNDVRPPVDRPDDPPLLARVSSQTGYIRLLGIILEIRIDVAQSPVGSMELGDYPLAAQFQQAQIHWPHESGVVAENEYIVRAHRIHKEQRLQQYQQRAPRPTGPSAAALLPFHHQVIYQMKQQVVSRAAFVAVAVAIHIHKGGFMPKLPECVSQGAVVTGDLDQAKEDTAFVLRLGHFQVVAWRLAIEG